MKGAELARATGASLELFHGLSNPIPAELAYAKGGLAEVERSFARRCLADLEKTAGQLRRRGVRVSTAAEWDFPAYEAVVRRAMRIKADLIRPDRHQGGARRHGFCI